MGRIVGGSWLAWEDEEGELAYAEALVPALGGGQAHSSH